MIDVCFHYTNWAGKKKQRTVRNIPESFNELNEWQLKGICALMHKNLKETDFRFRAARYVLSLSAVRFAFTDLRLVQSVMEQIGWLDNKNTLTRQIIPVYRKNLFSKRLVAAESSFSNFIMQEWNACEVYYARIISAKNNRHLMENLDKLTAVIYREPKKNYNRIKDEDGDLRAPFNANTVPYRAKKYIKHWPLSVKHAALMWFDGCREALHKAYPVFDSGGEPSTDPRLFKLVRALSGTKYGSFKEVEMLNVHIVMSELMCLKKEAAELKRELDKAK